MAAVKLALAWTPYQVVLAYAAFRAVRRQMRGINTWEKTQHVGAHRPLRAPRPQTDGGNPPCRVNRPSRRPA